MFKIIFHIIHFLGIGCFYIAEVDVLVSMFPDCRIRTDTIKGYSFSKNPINNVKKMYKDIPSILIRSMEITKIW